MEVIEELKRQRTTLKSRATRFKTFVENYADSVENRIALESRLEKYNELWYEYHALQTKIDAILPKPDIAERERFEEVFFAVQAAARSKLGQYGINRIESHVNRQAENAIQNAPNAINHQTLIRLPVITLPNFNGSYEQWQQFYDTFKALVHGNPNLNDVQRFYYLKSALSGSAAQFSNLRLTIHHPIHELFNTPPILKESAELLRALLDNFQKHLRVLQQLKEPVDKWDTLIIYLMTSKLDPVTKKEWELKVVQEKLSTTKQLVEFINTRCEFLEALHPAQSRNTTVAHVTTNETGSNHLLQKCTSRNCRHCSKRHHFLLHTNERSNNDAQGAASSNNASTSSKDTNANIQACESPAATSVSMKTVGPNKFKPEVLLSTAVVYIRDDAGNFHKVRALLDNGSQSNFIAKSVCQRLGLQTNATKHSISCLNVTETQITETVQTTIVSSNTTYETGFNLFVVNQITRPILTRAINVNSISLPQHIELADPSFHTPQAVDILLGATVFWDILETDRIQLGAKQPVLQSTKLGWLLCGQIGPPINTLSHTNVTICGFVQNKDLQAQIEKFWHIEDMPNARILSKEQSKCEDIFQKEHRRTEDGRFEVPLLFREDPSTLGESRTNALKRLRGMERKFLRDPELQTRYIKFMEEYINLGHMSMLPVTEGQKINYLPHHAVTKESSITTKLRVVFDASSPTKSGKSLNDYLLVGSTIQPELFEIIIRFRLHSYVLTGDIVKMYRQVRIKPEHRAYQCILWRSNPEEPPTTYSLNTVTYGVASSPFLAIRSLQQLSVDHEKTYSAASVIARDFYVDDMITGAASVQQLREIKTQVTDILMTAGFELSKFRSNVSLGQDEHLDHYGLTDAKVLGLLWQSKADSLRYEATCNSIPEIVTKRTMLSLITQIFDPLGLIGPVTIKAKILMQSLWQLKIDWDTPIPETLRMIWLSYLQQLPSINKIAIPRHAILHQPRDIQLHGFCDASQSAYGACIYLRSVDDIGAVYVQLLTAKSHSEVTLAWIQGEPSQWQVFVGNRVAEIQRLTNQGDWAHVRSEDNPADLISRGILSEQLIDATI
ncbi:PREDICTED: uncharacterized protein LOC108765485 [Trachymyrmex cornetzi]|uniref:uncharacterized protein LOC108765485 n=1 Tax=Trachymyrmex cornetzi TaxID=471704 RepID=UPI00084F7A2D|nr:PREDICTED: uncharacterized protein LOC108765485 [Trachymyrmex cornetzi]